MKEKDNIIEQKEYLRTIFKKAIDARYKKPFLRSLGDFIDKCFIVFLLSLSIIFNPLNILIGAFIAICIILL